jgi:hypothetical protein
LYSGRRREGKGRKKMKTRDGDRERRMRRMSKLGEGEREVEEGPTNRAIIDQLLSHLTLH